MRNILFIKHGIKKDSILGYSQSSFPIDLIETLDVQQIELAIEILLNLFRNIRYSLNQKFELELTVSKLSNIKNLITQKELIKEIAAIKNEILNLSDINIDAKDSPQDSLAIQSNVNQNVLEELIKFLHATHKLTLASALEKVGSWILKGNELCLVFDLKNKFQAEIVKKDRKEIIEHASSILLAPVKLTVTIADFEKDKPTTTETDSRADVLKNIFDGEIIKGE